MKKKDFQKNAKKDNDYSIHRLPTFEQVHQSFC